MRKPFRPGAGATAYRLAELKAVIKRLDRISRNYDKLAAGASGYPRLRLINAAADVRRSAAERRAELKALQAPGE